jgi:hypothetical protein
MGAMSPATSVSQQGAAVDGAAGAGRLGRLWGGNGLALAAAALGVGLSCAVTLLLHLA